MRIALFAADAVGLRVARFLGQQSEGPVCVVVDRLDSKNLNRDILAATGVDESRVLRADRSASSLAGELAAYEPDLCLLAWWPYLLDEPAIQVPQIGCLNFHPSLLPHGRGKAPNFWTLVEGTPYGVTIHWVDAGIDSGDVAFQREIPVGWEDTGETLYRKALDSIVDLFVDSYPKILQGDVPRIPQSPARCHYQRELDAASQIHLDRSYSGRELLNLLRARTFAPHPGAWFDDSGARYEVRVELRQVGSSEGNKDAA
ncbi:MAG TPA: formyltransferase family protein [Pirellulaceae bacterium]|jgi:methionyl-tRNA formyltransferase|nr:formyltransferase family protein [Pirellulaceae bacterium]